jgi:hypothetical protein
MGTFLGIHLRMPTPWNGGLVALQGFYHGLTQRNREQLDATTGGSFMSLTLSRAKTLMDKIAENQS